MPAITAIYAYSVAHETASWEYEAPDDAEIRKRMDAILTGGFPISWRHKMNGWSAIPTPAPTGLHRALGFAQVGLLPRIGYKFGRWLDSVLMQRALRPVAELD